MESQQLIADLTRKVAELSLVIHNLFKGKQQAEETLQIVKTDVVKYMDDYKEMSLKKVEYLEKQLNQKENKCDQINKLSQENSKLKENMAHLASISKQNEALMKLKNESLDVYRDENQILLIKIKKYEKEQSEIKRSDNTAEINKLKSTITRLIQQHKLEVEKHIKENKCLKLNHETAVESNLKNFQISCKEKDNLNDQLEIIKKEKKEIEDEMSDLKNKYEKSDKQRKKALAENREMESSKQKFLTQINSLKRDLQKLKSSSGRPVVAVSDCSNEEQVEYLRKELQTCRLELANREQNYNRVFTKYSPTLFRNTICFNLSGVKKVTRNTLRTSLPYLPEFPKP